MDGSTLRMIIAIVLFIHAIGHIQGVLVALNLFSTEKWHSKSWLVDKLVGEKVSKFIALILWLICALGFLVTAFAFLDIGIPNDLWRPMAKVFSISSLLGVILYFPARKFVMAMMINRNQRKLNRELTDEEREVIRRKAYVAAAVVAMTFAFLYNRYIMKSFFGAG